MLKQPRSLIIEQACPAPFNPGSNSVVKHLLTGDVDFDVNQVVLSSLELRRCDCVGGVVLPSVGPPGPDRIKVKDKNHPNTDDVGCGIGQLPCACNANQDKDGIDDLEIPFRTPDMTSILELDAQVKGTVVTLALTGELTDGCQFVAYDCIQIVSSGPPPGRLSVTANENADAQSGDGLCASGIFLLGPFMLAFLGIRFRGKKGLRR